MDKKFLHIFQGVSFQSLQRTRGVMRFVVLLSLILSACSTFGKRELRSERISGYVLEGASPELREVFDEIMSDFRFGSGNPVLKVRIENERFSKSILSYKPSGEPSAYSYRLDFDARLLNRKEDIIPVRVRRNLSYWDSSILNAEEENDQIIRRIYFDAVSDLIEQSVELDELSSH